MCDYKREAIDEANMTFNYRDLISLRLLYEWKQTSRIKAEKLPEVYKKFLDEKERIIDEEAKHKADQDQRIKQIQLDFDNIEVETERNRVKFTAKYAIIFANEFYDKLRTVEPGLQDLKWTKNDLINARPTIEMLGIPRENVYELVDSSKEQVEAVIVKLRKQIREKSKHLAKDESVFVYAYAAGHGLGGVRQYLLLNENSRKEALFEIEADLR